MFDAHPSFRFKHKREGHEFELEIRASLFRWLLIAIIILACLARQIGPSQVLGILSDSVPLTDSYGLSRRPCEILQALFPASECSGRPATKMPTRKQARSGTGKKKKPVQRDCVESK